MIRKLSFIAILICILYFIVGYVATYMGYLSSVTFNSYATLIAGVASLVGLIALLRPAITQSDIQDLEVNALKSISNSAERLEKVNKQKAVTEQELQELSLQRQEMQLLVKKASLSLFLRDQLERQTEIIQGCVKDNQELYSALNEYDKIREKLAALQEDIDADKNVDLLREIISTATNEPNEEFSIIHFLSPFGLAEDIVKILSRLSR